MADHLNPGGSPTEGLPRSTAESPSRHWSVVDRAYEEYRRRRQAGEPLDPDEFCKRFPGVKSSLGQLLRVDLFYEAHPELNPGQVPIPWPQLGETFLGFTLQRELGRGGFARVFLAAEQSVGGRQVVLKVSPQGGAEAETLGRIEHPNIVHVHSARQDQLSGLTGVCMPYLGSSTLCNLLDRAFAGQHPPTHARIILEAARGDHPEGPPPAGRQSPPSLLRKGTYLEGVLYLGVQLAEALAFIHGQGVCHRDLKPSNVLLNPDGKPMLLDFNLSADSRSAPFQLGGTLPYMSPEQLLALGQTGVSDPALLDPRTDLFALAVILCELLTGKHPFGPVPLKRHPKELRLYLLEQQRGGPRSLRSARPRMERWLARILERCLAYNPNDRPQSAAELAATLRKGLSPLRRTLRWLRRHRRAVFTTGLLLLAAGLVGGRLWALREPSSVRQFQQGRLAYRNGQYPQAVEHFNEALEADPRSAEALFARGRAYQQLGPVDRENYTRAWEDFVKADKLAPSGRTKACIGYCLNHKGLPHDAILSYTQAIEAGFRSAEVFNNLGCTQMEVGKLVEAQNNLDRAVQLNPQFRTALYNRARLALATTSLEQGITDIREAIRLGADTAEVYRDAARLCALAARHNPHLVDSALDYLARVVDKGYRPDPKEPFLKVVKDHPQFVFWTRKNLPSSIPQEIPRLVDPLTTASD